MSQFTAIVLSAEPVSLVVPGVTVLGLTQLISNPTQFNDVRLNSLSQVTTPFCFFLDDDDELPEDYLDVLNECASHDVAIAYTDEMVVNEHSRVVRQAGPYSAETHLRNPMLIHGLALMKTEAAVRTAPQLPRGPYWPQMTLFFKLAAQSVAYVPRVGYVWNKHDGHGMHKRGDSLIAQVRAKKWCAGEALCL
jgi:hypothetical protein